MQWKQQEAISRIGHCLKTDCQFEKIKARWRSRHLNCFWIEDKKLTFGYKISTREDPIQPSHQYLLLLFSRTLTTWLCSYFQLTPAMVLLCLIIWSSRVSNMFQNVESPRIIATDGSTELWRPPNVFLNGLTPASFSFIFGLFKQYNTISTTNQCEKCPNVHLVYSAGIQTHDLLNMSRQP